MGSAKVVGIRQLRQNLSKYVSRVLRGERFRVTARGRPVALLTPLPERATLLEQMISDGKILPARLKLPQLGKPTLAAREISISQALAEQRAEG